MSGVGIDRKKGFSKREPYILMSMGERHMKIVSLYLIKREFILVSISHWYFCLVCCYLGYGILIPLKKKTTSTRITKQYGSFLRKWSTLSSWKTIMKIDLLDWENFELRKKMDETSEKYRTFGKTEWCECNTVVEFNFVENLENGAPS